MSYVLECCVCLAYVLSVSLCAGHRIMRLLQYQNFKLR